MTEHQHQPDVPPGSGGSSTAPERDRSGSLWSVLAPAAALLVGLVLGGVLVGVMNDDDDNEPSAEPEASASPTPGDASPSESATIIVVPNECLEAADSVEEALQLVERGAAALRDFESAELRELLRELEALDAQARAQAEACQEVQTEQSPSE